ncbi:Transketolase-like, pyrimidine-binding domain-containing protein [Rozella allomycis CSF55]|uniref:Transketolase-like, pyrimidine-binding domain-containing protein n=1 Tax=Rozella allomycis (strain CSF55) TaxID=988480 RepID=A0A075ARV9_ROZAC|nr:Transketolase-like, pyrimidine-binding domain-containing protein [Rozella allomycis CSF55]|eukprot:EPZ32973.1 Transketolase-like, pyrimidine-binding domain-containing protein [Rozella allomycis CSF55]
MLLKRRWLPLLFKNTRLYKETPETSYGYFPITPYKQAHSNFIHAKSDIKNLYRFYGYQYATINPLEVQENQDFVGYPFDYCVDSNMKEIYCGDIGYEFRHVSSHYEREWFINRIESGTKEISSDVRRDILKYLLQSEVWDQFMSKRFGQVKRYGLEGGETMLTSVQSLILGCVNRNNININIFDGIENVVIGMPHRGRLNLLQVLLKDDPRRTFYKLKGNSEFGQLAGISGDVLSHLSIFKDLDIDGRKIHISLLPNPSHLEAINPVAMGKSRAKEHAFIEQGKSQKLGDKVLCLQIHGDAAFYGQGYTCEKDNSRSSKYASDIAKIVDAPVIHVNGLNPEAVYHATRLAIDYRQAMRKDVVIDLQVFRRWGHNELDEPSFTQPLMYTKIREGVSIADKYSKLLLKTSVIEEKSITDIRTAFFQYLDDCLKKVDTIQLRPNQKDKDNDSNFVNTKVAKNTLKEIGVKSVEIPSAMQIHPRLIKFFISERLKDLNDERIDWATAESLAFGSLLLEGYHVRLSGQDVGRGTFSQRHGILVDQTNDSVIIPLNIMSRDQGKIEFANSFLSEFAVMGFDYGVSLESRNRLVIWEAQFGDFLNGAQIIIDAFISGGESKWMVQSAMVLLLPHGYDGAGPEHSSARIERFLQLSNERFIPSEGEYFNMYIANPSTPAQYFHLLRRQMKSRLRKPLIIFSPKMLLRLPEARSTLDELSDGEFKTLIFDQEDLKSEIDTVIFLSGKFYYEIAKEIRKRNMKNFMLVRIEELCPFPWNDLITLRNQLKFKNIKKFLWCQEEHQNMGAYTYVYPRLQAILLETIKYVGRPASSSPAAGFSKLHKEELYHIYESLFDPK